MKKFYTLPSLPVGFPSLLQIFWILRRYHASIPFYIPNSYNFLNSSKYKCKRIYSAHQFNFLDVVYHSRSWHTFLYIIGNYWYADTLFASGYRYNRSGLYAKALPFLASSTKASPYEPSYHDELAQTYAGLSAEAFENKNATDAARLSTLAIQESDKALSTSPKNVNFYKTRTKVLYTLSVLNPEYNNDAVTSLRAAITLSPNDPKIYYNLAILLGRQNESSEAITNLLVAKKLKKTIATSTTHSTSFILKPKNPLTPWPY